MDIIQVVCGSILSDRSERIQRLWAQKHEKALLLTPTRRLAQRRQEELLREEQLPGIWGQRAFELSDFAALLLERSGRPVRMVSQLERCRIVWLALKELAEEEKDVPTISPGFVRHLLQVITSMKQGAVEVPDLEKAIQESNEPHPFDSVVCRIYDAYQRALLSRGLYDVPGLFWEIEQRCREGLITLAAHEQWLLFDGFDDFTPSQQRLLLALAPLASGMVIGLNYDAHSPNHKDLYTLQQQWLEKFHRKASIELVTCTTRDTTGYTEHGAKYIFGRDPAPEPAPSLHANFRMKACADARHEIESIGRAIKSLIVDEQQRPEDIAVALCDMEQQAAVVEEVFTAFQIPFMMRAPLPLSRSYPAIFLGRLMAVMKRRDLQEMTPLLSSAALADPDDDPRAIRALSLLIRESGIVGPVHKRPAAMHYLEWLIEQQEGTKKRRRLSPGCTSAAWKLLKKRLNLLDSLAASLPEEGTFLSYSEALSALLDLPGLNRDGEEGRQDREALKALRRILAELAIPEYKDRAISFTDYFALFQMALSQHSLPRRSRGGVFCCTPDELRLNQFPYVFLGGLNEGSIPRAPSVNALYSDRDLRRLRRQNLPLPGMQEYLQRQRLLFHHNLCAAEKELRLSWRNQDSEGREILPSPFVIELKELFPDTLSLQDPESGPDCFIADLEQIASTDDLLQAAIYRDVELKDAELKTAFTAIAPLRAMEQLRYKDKQFSVVDGIIKDQTLLNWLQDRFGDKHQFSVSQLENYVKFPFLFFTKYVLRIRETRPPDGELSPLLRGIIIHDTLKVFYSLYKEGSGRILTDMSQEEWAVQLADSLSSTFEGQRTALQSLTPILVEMERLRLEQVLQRFVLQRLEKDEGFVPWELEFSFGNTPGAAESDEALIPPFSFSLGEESILIAGTIDRVDKQGNQLRLIDYKSSSAPEKREIIQGVALQLSVYATAAKELFPDYHCVDAWYLPVLKGKGSEALLTKKEEDFIEREEKTVETIAQAVWGIRNGHFPPVPHDTLDTNRFPFPSAARFESWRLEHKEALPTAPISPKPAIM